MATATLRHGDRETSSKRVDELIRYVLLRSGLARTDEAELTQILTCAAVRHHARTGEPLLRLPIIREATGVPVVPALEAAIRSAVPGVADLGAFTETEIASVDEAIALTPEQRLEPVLSTAPWDLQQADAFQARVRRNRASRSGLWCI